MIEKELYKKAEEQCKNDFCIHCLRFGECEKSIPLCSKATSYCKSIVIEILLQENAELKEQIEKLKTCSRCMSNNKDLEEYPCKNCYKDGVYTNWH